MRDDRREVDLLDERVPLDRSRIETEPLLVISVAALEEFEQPVDAEDGFGLRVRAVQLDIPEGPFRLRPSFFEASREVGLLPADRKRRRQSLRGCYEFGGPLELALHAAPTRE